MSRIEVEHLAFAYGQRLVIDGLSLVVEEGRFFAVMGPNGSGKSTLLALLAGLLSPLRGRIVLDGRDLHELSIRRRAERMAFVRQDTTSAFDYTVEEIVMMARFQRQRRRLYERPDDYEAVRLALREAAVDHLAERPITALSGGERQRVFIARALAQDTPILLMDEPTSHLDLRHQIAVFELLRTLQRDKGKTIVLVSHDLNLTRRYADRVLLLGAEPAHSRQGSADEVLLPDVVREFFGVETVLADSPHGAFLIPRSKS
jgi:iron complex transport system ATP-binding protein